MASSARLVVPGRPHHVTQRGNRLQPTFFHEEDYVAYLDLMADRCRDEGVAIWGYCLMPNHVHLIAVPETPRDFGEQSVKPTAATPRESIGMNDGLGTCGKVGSRRS